MKRLFGLLLISLLFSCQTFVPNAEKAANITSKALYVDELVKSGAIEDSLFSSQLTDKETNTIRQSLEAYNTFTGKWGKLIAKNPVEAITHTTLVINEYNVLRLRYVEVERIVELNWDRYPVNKQVILKEYQAQIKELDDLVMNLLGQANINHALIVVMKIAQVTGQIALKIL